MKTKAFRVATIVAFTALLLSVANLNASSAPEYIHSIFPTLGERAEYWHKSTIVFDAQCTGGLRVLCGKAILRIGPENISIRVMKDQQTIQEAYFLCSNVGDPIFREEKDRILVLTPSGSILLETKKG